MNSFLKATLMLLGAGCVLLLAGAFPLAGAPGVYHGGLMAALGVAVAALSTWGAWRLARGSMLRLLGGCICAALAGAGGAGCVVFGAECFSYARLGGAMWFGVVAMGCYALVGLLFLGIFTFLALRLMTRRLWLAALHLSLVLLLAGAYADAVGGAAYPCSCIVGAAPVSPRTAPPGFPFRLQVLHFEVERYAAAESYTLLEHRQGRWVPLATPRRSGDALVLGDERWPVSSLVRAPGMPQPFRLLPGAPPRLLLAQPGPVREFRATCRLIPQQGAAREEQLRVNAPISCEGWRVYLMHYSEHGGRTVVELLLRRSPGRLPALAGMVALILCSIGWSFTPKPKP